MSSTSSSTEHKGLTPREIVILAMMAALMMGGKVVMASLPNIEPVSLLIIVGTLVFGKKYLCSVVIYVVLEGLIYGFGLWWFCYLYVWPVLLIATLIFKRFRSYAVLTVMSAVFGLAFGALCAIFFAVACGPFSGFSSWVAGIPYDVAHCVGNGVLAAALLRPLHKLLARCAGVPLWPERPEEGEKSGTK